MLGPYKFNLQVVVNHRQFLQERQVRELIDSHGVGTFVYPMEYRSRNRHRNRRTERFLAMALGWVQILYAVEYVIICH